MSGTDYERELKKLLIEDGFTVIRSAGSMGEADLTAAKRTWGPGGLAETHLYFLECKSTKNMRFDIDNEMLREQRDHLVRLMEKGFKVFYAFRYKSRKHHKNPRDKWHFIAPEPGMKSFKWNADFYYYQDVMW